MGSRLMHLIIANKIAQYMSIENKTLFLLGNIAPDAVPTKDISHFFAGNSKDLSRHLDFNGFLHKYRTHIDSHYILGYFTHLIADDIWVKGFYLPWLKNRMEANREIHTLHHNDFRLLNGKLLNYYGFADEIKRMLIYAPTVLDLEEVTSKDVEQFIPSVLGDMENDKDITTETLNLYTFDQIIGYIETSVEQGVLHVKPLLQ
ncbi:zinc dependent phospholipase C family protein [Paenibacillus sp. GSMTC-2017]|uniref:zinc dependent phospholipase C family protein n=1 Tax=Paenibacillus sp. GSMTC-2017 TaxID=2794350 RepID=UPI0018D730A0|nr:zinc dependent phospholipase C family protein [Paenibacillus sp. GSMTC-2017]MBH5317626.1 zinc dependent phospholipase C family protein [Paenibacillus sp. GSMTC-2017]